MTHDIADILPGDNSHIVALLRSGQQYAADHAPEKAREAFEAVLDIVDEASVLELASRHPATGRDCSSRCTCAMLTPHFTT